MNLGPQGSGGSSSDTTGVFALLSLIVDPAAAQARLKEITDKAAEAQGFLEQASATNGKAEVTRLTNEKRYAEIQDLIKQNAAKEVDLAAREQKLAAGIADLYNREQKLTSDRNSLSQEQATWAAAYSKQSASLQREKDAFADMTKQTLANMQAEQAAALSNIQSSWSSRLENAKQVEAAAQAKLAEAGQALNEAVAAKQDYADRLNKLKALVGS